LGERGKVPTETNDGFPYHHHDPTIPTKPTGDAREGEEEFGRPSPHAKVKWEVEGRMFGVQEASDQGAFATDVAFFPLRRLCITMEEMGSGIMEQDDTGWDEAIVTAESFAIDLMLLSMLWIFAD
jgi:hypothetical protein